MQSKILNKEDIGQVYRLYLARDFDPAEIKPLSVIEDLFDQGFYYGHGLYDDAGQLCGYALLCDCPGGEMPLLDYLAVTPERRGQGIGGLLLQMLRQEYAAKRGLILEVENPAFAADQADLTEKQRRVAFYLRQGVEQTSGCCRLFGVELVLMYLPLSAPADGAAVSEALRQIYQYSAAKHLQSGKIAVSCQMD